MDSATATIHQDEVMKTLDYNLLLGTVPPSPHGKGNNCENTTKELIHCCYVTNNRVPLCTSMDLWKSKVRQDALEESASSAVNACYQGIY